MARTAVVLMNLGGPDRLEAVRPFLTNLFSDPAILRLPGFVRLPLARIIAWRRARVAREIYRKLGGGSPLLANTEAQARALEAVLGPEHRCFVAMRYWHPTSDGISLPLCLASLEKSRKSSIWHLTGLFFGTTFLS